MQSRVAWTQVACPRRGRPPSWVWTSGVGAGEAGRVLQTCATGGRATPGARGRSSKQMPRGADTTPQLARRPRTTKPEVGRSRTKSVHSGVTPADVGPNLVESGPSRSNYGRSRSTICQSLVNLAHVRQILPRLHFRPVKRGPAVSTRFDRSVPDTGPLHPEVEQGSSRDADDIAGPLRKREGRWGGTARNGKKRGDEPLGGRSSAVTGL